MSNDGARLTTTADLLSAIEVVAAQPLPDGTEAWEGIGWAARSAWWVFGGSVAAQALAAAGRSAPDRVPRSLQVRFLRQAAPGSHIRHEIVPLSESGTFTDRLVRSLVDGQRIATTTVVYHSPDDTPLGHHEPMPTVPSVNDGGAVASGVGFEFVDLCDPPMMASRAAPSAMQLWMRAPEAPRDDVITNAAMLTMASDLFTAQSAWRPIDGLAIRHVDKVMAFGLSLSVWFHRPVAMADWHLNVTNTPVAAAGRSLSFGHWYTESGELVASFVLDSVMRLRR